MAFYFLGDGTVDVPVWFDDEAYYFAALQAVFSTLLNQDITTPNRVGTVLGTEQIQPSFEEAWPQPVWLASYTLAAGDDAWSSAEDSVLPSLNLTASQTLGDLSQSVSMALTGAVTASQTLDTITQAATLSTSVAALSLTASQTLGDVTQSATLANVAALAASQTIGSLTQSASLANVVSVAASQSIDSISQTATFAGVTAALNISASQTLDNIVQFATLSNAAIQTGTGGGVPATRQKRLTRIQEDKLSHAIDELLAAETSVKQARTPRVRAAKLATAVEQLTAAKTEIETQQDVFAPIAIDLTSLIAQINMMIEGQAQFTAGREALLNSIHEARLAAQQLITSDDDDMLLLLMLAA